MAVMFNLRLKQLQLGLIKPILIKKPANLFYLTGRSFDLRAEEYLLVKPINTDQTRRDTGMVGFGSGLEQMKWIKTNDRLKNIGEYLKGFNQLDIEYGFTFGEAKYLRYKIKDSGLKIKVTAEKSAVDEMRQVKDIGELAKIKKSMQIVEKVFELVKKKLANRSLGTW
jgi:Xaa-Pro aminopeptidase